MDTNVIISPSYGHHTAVGSTLKLTVNLHFQYKHKQCTVGQHSCSYCSYNFKDAKPCPTRVFVTCSTLFILLASDEKLGGAWERAY